jgi:hypothetical protein
MAPVTFLFLRPIAGEDRNGPAQEGKPIVRKTFLATIFAIAYQTDPA